MEALNENSPNVKCSISGKILGTGDMFHPEIPNSSFLVTLTPLAAKSDPVNILVDCGYNIYPELVKQNLIDDIDIVKITHDHADHNGSLEALIYHKIFKSSNSKDIKLRFKNNAQQDIYYNDRYNKIVINGKFIDNEFLKKPKVYLYNLPRYKNLEYNLYTYRKNKGSNLSFKTTMWFGNSHFHENSIGYVFTDNINNRFIIISGDTKADYTIKNFMDFVMNETDKTIVLFHDLSLESSSFLTPHCTYSEFKEMYGNLNDNNELYNGRTKVIFYHNNDETIIGKTF